MRKVTPDDNTIWINDYAYVNREVSRIFGRYWIGWKFEDFNYHGTWRPTEGSAIRLARRKQKRISKLRTQIEARPIRND